MRFKTKRITKEFTDVDNLNPRLRAFLQWIDDKTTAEWGKEIFITCLDRTLAQNIKRGGHPQSYHMVRPCSAADIRTTTTKWFTRLQQEAIKGWFDEYHACRTGDKCLIKGNHIHTQMEFSPNTDMDAVDISGVV